MKVTGFDLKRTADESKNVLSFGKIVIEDTFEIDVKIVRGKDGLFVSYPSHKGSNERWYPQFRFIKREVADAIQDQVITYYEKFVKTA